MKRYEALALETADSIASGQLGLGDRVPSVRDTSRSRGISLSTVFQAYYLLEAQGLIKARPPPLRPLRALRNATGLWLARH